MIRTNFVATMETAGGQVVLEEVGVDAAVDDLMTVVSVSQRYRNPGARHVEAVYTFPLPLDGVLLNFAFELQDRTLTGTVIAKREAEERYENAITDGDAAVRLEQPQPGLYTANVGNLGPGETATVRFRYGLLLRWNGDLVRLMMPTTIAPRYGAPAAGGLDPHQAPEFAFDAERCFRLQVAVRGVLQGARWASPSHAIAVTPDAYQTVIEIARPAAMDRDVVLEARGAAAAEPRALLARDAAEWVVLASFRPALTGEESAAARSLKIVVDCSGSMSGDSIAQVRIAGMRILDSLRPGDLFDIVAFGSSQRILFGREMPASAANLAHARRFVRGLDADLGGTEIRAALRAAYRVPGEAGMARDLLLITDGEVWDTGRVVAEARASGHRIFTVGVGSSVAEPFVRALAEATGGACELVAPREDMADRIYRHFQRILTPLARAARVVWPAGVRQMVPDPLPPPYPGDTMHLFGTFAARPLGAVVLELELADGRTLRQRMEIAPAPDDTAAAAGMNAARSDLARIGAALRLPALADAAAATELAVRYQLVSEWTDYLVVHVRAEYDKAPDLPELAKVPQVLAAGWHGTGTVHDAADARVAYDRPAPIFEERVVEYDIPFGDFDQEASAPSAPPSAPPRTRVGDADTARSSRKFSTRRLLPDSMAEPARLADRRPPLPPVSPDEFVAALNASPLPPAPTLDDLLRRRLPTAVIEALEELLDGGLDSQTAALIFLYLLCQSPAGRTLERQQRRVILSAYKKQAPGAAAVSAVRRVWQDWAGA